MVALVGAALTTPALSARNSAVELQSHMVGRVGIEPTESETLDLQSSPLPSTGYLPIL